MKVSVFKLTLSVKNRFGMEEGKSSYQVRNNEVGNNRKKEVVVIKTEKLITKEDKDDIEILKKKETETKDLSTIINQFSKKQDNGVYPITIPYQQEVDQENKTEDSNKDLFELKEEEPFLIQFPRILPYIIQEQINNKQLETTEENINDSNNYFENKFNNSFLKLGNNAKLGKFKVYKSGKITLKLGEVEYNVTQGITNSFSQELFYEKDNQGFILGKLKSDKLLVAPKI